MATISLGQLQADMNAYAVRLQRGAEEASERVAAFVHQRTVERARQDAEWAGLADSIEVWSQDGKFVLGIRDNELASQAFQIEYGDETKAPAPLFRLAGRDLTDAYQNVFTTAGPLG